MRQGPAFPLTVSNVLINPVDAALRPVDVPGVDAEQDSDPCPALRASSDAVTAALTVGVM